MHKEARTPRGYLFAFAPTVPTVAVSFGSAATGSPKPDTFSERAPESNGMRGGVNMFASGVGELPPCKRQRLSPFVQKKSAQQCLRRVGRVLGASNRAVLEPLQTAPQYAATLEDAKTTAFTDWAKSVGITWQSIRPASFGGGLRGLVATSSIPKETVVVGVPRGAAITLTPTQKCPFPESVIAKDMWASAPWYLKLALRLLHEKVQGDKSTFQRYIELLPQTLEFPVNWDDDKLQNLQYPYLINKVKEQRREWQDMYVAIKKGCPNPPFTERDLFWAMGCVRSRTFSGPYIGSTLQDRIRLASMVGALSLGNAVLGLADVQRIAAAAIAVFVFNILYEIILSGKLKQHALCPVIDLFNHSNTVESEISYDYFQDRYSVSASHDYKASEQVFISYGAQSNDSLMQFYGFCETNNVRDVYVMTSMLKWLEQKQSASLSRLDKLNAAGLLSNLQEVSIQREGFPGETLQSLRYLLADEAEAAKGPDAFRNSGSAEVESKLAAVLVHACQCELQHLGTSLREDEGMLARARGRSSSHVQLAVRFRMEKKRVLQACLGRLTSGAPPPATPINA